MSNQSKKIIIVFLGVVLSVYSNNSLAKNYNSKCGSSYFLIISENHGHPLDNKFKLFVSKDGKKNILFESDKGGWFNAICIEKNQTIPLLLFQSYCGGSSCVEDNYGIVNTLTNKFLLIPEKENIGNSKKAAKILGENIRVLMRKNKSFCCE